MRDRHPALLVAPALAAALATPGLAQDFLIAGPLGLTQVDRQGQVVRHVPAPSGGPLDHYVDLIDLPDGTWLARYQEEVLGQGLQVHARVFDRAGVEVEEWKLPGPVTGRSLGTLSDGRLILGESRTSGSIWGRVQLTSSDGDPLGVLGTVYGSTCGGVAVGAGDLLWVGRWHPWSMDVLDRDGVTLASFPVSHYEDFDLAPDGSLWMLGADGVLRRYDRNGTLLTSFVVGLQSAFVVDVDGSLWTSSGDHYDPAGNWLGSIAFPDHPLGLALARGPREVGEPSCAGNPNSTGVAGRLTAHGATAADAELLTLEASSLPAARLAVLLVATGGGHVPGWRGGQGDLCLDPLRLQPLGLRATGPGGSAWWDPDLDALPIPGGTAEVLAGSTWAWQVWYRDANPQPTSNLTGAVRVRFE